MRKKELIFFAVSALILSNEVALGTNENAPTGKAADSKGEQLQLAQPFKQSVMPTCLEQLCGKSACDTQAEVEGAGCLDRLCPCGKRRAPVPGDEQGVCCAAIALFTYERLLFLGFFIG